MYESVSTRVMISAAVRSPRPFDPLVLSPTAESSAAGVTLVRSTPFDPFCVSSPAAKTGTNVPVIVAARRKAESALKTCDFFMKIDSSSSISHLRCVRIACHMRRKIAFKMISYIYTKVKHRFMNRFFMHSHTPRHALIRFFPSSAHPCRYALSSTRGRSAKKSPGDEKAPIWPCFFRPNTHAK